MTQHLDLDASINTLQQLAKQGKDDPFNYMNVLCSTMDALIDRLRKAEAASKSPDHVIVPAEQFLAVLDRSDWRTAKNRAELRAMLAAPTADSEGVKDV